MTSTDTGEANTEVSGELTIDSAADAFLSRLADAPDDENRKKPSEGANEEADEASDETADDSDTSEDDASDESPDGDEDDGAAEKAKKYVEVDDNTFVKIKVGEEEHEVPVKDLNRLFGQEAALTRKSQEVAEARKKADADAAKAVASLNVLLTRAKEKADPYKQIDFLVASKELSSEELGLLRSEAQRAMEEERFLETELNGFMQAIQEKQKTEFVTQAKACVTALKDATSPAYIEGWNDTLYNDLRSFAVAQGVDQEIVNNIVEPSVIKLLHMAMQFQRGNKQVQTVKTNKTPKKIIKTSQTPVARDPVKAKSAKAMQNLKNSGSVDDAANAFLARMTSSDD